MAIGIDTTSGFTITTTLLSLLLIQMNNPLWPRYFEYVYPLDYLTNLGPCTMYFFGFCINYVPSACSGGPAGTLPKYDFIIVGAGPAGSTLAYRLGVQYPNRYVLLIETGQAPTVDVVPPTYFPFGLNNSNGFIYTSEPNYLNVVDGSGNTCSRTEGTGTRYGLGYTNGLPIDAGKALGGGTVLNAMIWACGTSYDYEGWKNSTGVNGWGWGSGTTNDGMWWYYKKTMKMGNPNIPQCANYYGTSGPLEVNDPKSADSAIPLLKAAAIERGYPILPDYNCGKYIGLANVHQTIKNSERNHAARAFLSQLFANRPNVMVMRGATVDKILLSGTLGGTVTATGVRVVTNNTNCPSFNVFAKNEIILTAGAYNTPLILQRSGVGRKCDLTGSTFSVPQLVDSPVGNNYHDHPIDVVFFTLDPTQAEKDAAASALTRYAAQAENYYWYRNDTLSYVGSMNWNFFINTNDNPINPNSNPNIQLLCYQFDLMQIEFARILAKFGFSSQYANQILAANQNKKIIMCFNFLLDAKSRGLVRIRSTNPTDPPRIHGNFVSDPRDIATANAGIKKLFELINTTAFKNVNAEHLRLNITECDSLTYQSSDYWNCYRKYFGRTIWHPAGTCKMGKTTDPSAVVDTNLIVKGISGTVKVRVADASIMPQITSGNTQCPVYAIAEKAFDIIKPLYV